MENKNPYLNEDPKILAKKLKQYFPVFIDYLKIKLALIEKGYSIEIKDNKLEIFKKETL